MARRLFQHAQEPGNAAGTWSEARSGPEEKKPTLARSGLTRRAFLVRGSLAAGAAAVAGSVPGVSNILSAAGADSPEIDSGAGPLAGAGAELGPGVSQPIVAHVVDAASGEINLYQGTAQVVTRNPGLAQAIARLAVPRN